MPRLPPELSFFFFNDTATTEIYTLSLHDALPICDSRHQRDRARLGKPARGRQDPGLSCGLLPDHPRFPQLVTDIDRKSTRLNSSHGYISYAVFCLKKKRN